MSNTNSMFFFSQDISPTASSVMTSMAPQSLAACRAVETAVQKKFCKHLLSRTPLGIQRDFSSVNTIRRLIKIHRREKHHPFLRLKRLKTGSHWDQCVRFCSRIVVLGPLRVTVEGMLIALGSYCARKAVRNMCLRSAMTIIVPELVGRRVQLPLLL